MTIYKGYRIQPSLTRTSFFVMKDGFNIATANSEADARQMIDQLVNGFNNETGNVEPARLYVHFEQSDGKLYGEF